MSSGQSFGDCCSHLGASLGRKIIELPPCLAIATLFPNRASKPESVLFVFPSWCRNRGPPLAQSWVCVAAHAQLHRRSCLRGQGSGAACLPGRACAGSSGFCSGFPCLCGLNQSLKAGRVPWERYHGLIIYSRRQRQRGVFLILTNVSR